MLSEDAVAQMGLKPHHFQLLHRILSGNCAVNHAWVFGSRALGTFKPSSDIDIALQGEGLTLNDVAQLLDQFEQSSLPFKVDLVVMHKINSTELIEHITQHGVPVF